MSLSSRDKIIILEDKEKEEDRSLTNSLFNKNSSISNTQKLTLERSRSTKELANKGNQTLKKKTSLDSAKNLKEINGKNLQPNDELEVDLNFNDDKITFKSFKILRVLGSGAFGKVFMVRKKDTGQIFAMKALKKRTLIQKKQLKYAVSEANILKNSNHPYILKLHYAFQVFKINI